MKKIIARIALSIIGLVLFIAWIHKPAEQYGYLVAITGGIMLLAVLFGIGFLIMWLIISAFE